MTIQYSGTTTSAVQNSDDTPTATCRPLRTARRTRSFRFAVGRSSSARGGDGGAVRLVVTVM
jgi:hypothetical protein